LKIFILISFWIHLYLLLVLIYFIQLFKSIFYLRVLLHVLTFN
jgi:hypothetical protein